MNSLAQILGSGKTPLWVSGRTYQVGQVVQSPGDNYQQYVRAVAGAGTTDPSADSTNWRPYGGRAIKSIQRGSLSFASNSATVSATITAVNTAKAVLTNLGGLAPLSNGEADFPRLSLTNSTTVTATCRVGAASPGGQIVNWQIVEFY